MYSPASGARGSSGLLGWHLSSVSQNQLPQERTHIFHPLPQHLFRNALIDAIKCVCEHLQSQIISCISPSNVDGRVLLVEDKYCLKRVTVRQSFKTESFKNGPNGINRIWIHAGWHHPVAPEKPLEGILFLTYTRWPFWFFELHL